MRSIVRWCLTRRPVVLFATLLVLAGGVFGATQLRQQLFPDFEFPFAIVTLEAPGLDATNVDAKAAKPIERAISSVDGIEEVTTISSEGRLRIYAQLSYGIDTDDVKRDIESAIDTVELPSSMASPEFAGGFQEQAVVLATISASDDNIAALSAEAEQVKADLQSVDGVGRVDLAGVVNRQLLVQINKSAFDAGITPQTVADAIKASDLRANVGMSISQQGPLGIVVEGPGTDRTKEGLGSLLVDGLPLASLAKIVETNTSDNGFALVNGKPSLTLSVFRKTGSDEVTTVDAIIDTLNQADTELDRASISILYEGASEVRNLIQGLVIEGVLGAFFAVVVIFLFLRSIRSTLVAAVSIPTSIVFGLLAAWMLGLTMNIVTLAGLTIAIGRVIDDGIVVLENIHKHLEQGEPRFRAMVDGTGEVAMPIASSTIATAAVFLPIGLVGGLISEIFLSFSIIVTVALLASLLVAITVVPVIGSFVLHAPNQHPHDKDSTLARFVLPATRFGIRWRWPVLGIAIASMTAVFWAVAAGAIPVQFLPSEGVNRVHGAVQLPPGTNSHAARKLLAPLDKQLGTLDNVKNLQLTYGIMSGTAAFDPTIGASTAEFYITLKEGANSSKVESQLRKFGEAQYPGAFTVSKLEQGPPSGSFQLNIRADNLEAIAKAAQTIKQQMIKNSKKWSLVEIEAQAAQSMPQLVVRLRPDADVDPSMLQSIISSTTTPVNVEPSERSSVPISIGTQIELNADPKIIGSLPITTRSGKKTTVSEVTTFETVDVPTFINRIDGALSGTITARMLTDDTSGTTESIRQEVEKLDLPKGVTLDWNQGDQAFVNEMFSDMMIAMVVAITLVFLVLLVFFSSIVHPFTILAPVMFSFIGSFGALILTGRALGLPAMIGQLLLIGIIVSNSILLVDAALRLRASGAKRDDALLGAAKLRVRPVLMTASATIAALTPLSLGVSGEGGLISKSLGTVVIGGLLVATLLTLVMVPAVFRILDRDHPRLSSNRQEEGKS